MSTAKRSRQQQSAASPPASNKRLKTTQNSHVPVQKGLGFLVNEDARTGRKLEAKLTNGVPPSKTNRVDESHAVVAPDSRDFKSVGASQDNAIGIPSDEESESESSSEESDDDDGDGMQALVKAEEGLANGHAREDEDSDSSESDAVAGAEDVDMDGRGEEEEEELEEMSFGDMLQARNPDPIDVNASFPNPMADRQALLPTWDTIRRTAPLATSLGTVLTQALKTNDKDLLESCFQTNDVPSIRSTIQRLQSQHVATLLRRLAERIYRRPGRTGNLLVWVQWALIAHGGYLATQPDVMKQLKSLSQVVRERANGLQPLLHLKGKLDMLSSQLDLRRSMAAASRAANASDDEDEEGVVYVEGQDEDWSDSDDEAKEEVRGDAKAFEAAKTKPKPQMATPRTDASDSDSDLPNGVVQQEDDDSSDAEEADEEDMLDIEAEESSGDDDEEADDSEASSASAPQDESGSSDDESDVSGGVKAPDMKTLDRKR